MVALHLTHPITGTSDWQLTRFPLRFHSTCNGHRYWHIVLVLQLTWRGFTEASPPSTPRRAQGVGEGWGSRFAAISLSRHPPLSFSTFSHPSLSSLCTALRAEYHHIGHHVLHITVGLPIDNVSDRSKEPLHWHFLSIPLPSAQCDALLLSPTDMAPDFNEEDESEDTEAGDVQRQGEPTIVKESEAVQSEWKVVRGILSRYSQRAKAVSHQLRLNACSPSIARPLPLVHPLVHWEPGTQQMRVVYKEKGKSLVGGKEANRALTAERQLHSARGHRTPPLRERFAV